MSVGLTLNLCLTRNAGQRIRIRCRDANGAVITDLTAWTFVLSMLDGDGTEVLNLTNGTGITFDTTTGNSDAYIQFTGVQTAARTAGEVYTYSILVTPTAREPQYLCAGAVKVQNFPSGASNGEPDITAILDGPITISLSTTIPGSPGTGGAGGNIDGGNPSSVYTNDQDIEGGAP